MKKIQKIKRKNSIHKSYLFGLTEKDFTREKFIEGAILRPSVLMLAFVSFIGGMFLLLNNNLKWGGSLIVFSFITNLYAIYESLKDEDTIFRTLNVGFKLVLFLSEVMAFNWLLLQILN